MNAPYQLALVDSLHEGTLNEAQAETVRQLRAGILALTERESTIQDVKVPSHVDWHNNSGVFHRQNRDIMISPQKRKAD